MAKLYYEKDTDLGALTGKAVAVVGYGIQGRAQALNLHDSGVDVTVGARPKGESWNAASKDGLETAPVGDAVASADVDVSMIPPKAPGAAVRENSLRGSGVPALLAVHQDATGKARSIALGIAKGIGSTKVGVIETTFVEETETDLFGGQVDLCGGVSELIRTSFDVLVKAGYQPELAYFEVLHEPQMIVDLIQAGGVGAMWAKGSTPGGDGGP